MPREIKFKGKDKRSGEWLYGSLVISDGKYFIFPWVLRKGIPTQLEEVYPDSVGQFIGLKDRRGEEIYEGDIIADSIKSLSPSVIEYGLDYPGFYKRNIRDKTWTGLGTSKRCGWPWQRSFNHLRQDMEIIGNIHYENPELLK